MSEKKNYSSLQRSNNIIEISESKFDALILKEVVDCIMNDEINKNTVNRKHLINLKKWLLKHDMLKNETSILCNVLKHFKINSNYESHQRNTTNLLEINTHNQLALNE